MASGQGRAGGSYYDHEEYGYRSHKAATEKKTAEHVDESVPSENRITPELDSHHYTHPVHGYRPKNKTTTSGKDTEDGGAGMREGGKSGDQHYSQYHPGSAASTRKKKAEDTNATSEWGNIPTGGRTTSTVAATGHSDEELDATEEDEQGGNEDGDTATTAEPKRQPPIIAKITFVKKD